MDWARANLTEAQAEIVERMGRHFEAEGVPRIGGRIYAYLLLQVEPQSLDDLAEVLRVSKTSVSTNTRLIESTHLVQRVTKPGDRRDYYQAPSDHTLSLLEFRLQHFRERGQLLKDARRAIPEEDGVVATRLALMDEFNREALQILEELLVSWHARGRRRA